MIKKRNIGNFFLSFLIRLYEYKRRKMRMKGGLRNERKGFDP